MTPAEMRQHVEVIAAEHGVTMDERDRTAARAFPGERKVRISRVTTARRYAMALHELGHVLSDGQRGTRLDKEVDAWRWAEAHAMDWTEAMEAERARALGTYVRWAQRRQRRDPRRVFITDQHPIWRWADA